MVGYQQLPPGFRFQPTDQEMIVCYLKKKVAGTASSVTSIIADVDIYKFDPWDLPGKAIVSGDGEWFFFSPRDRRAMLQLNTDRKYPNGGRPNRTAGSGYWKATGTDKPVLAGGGAQCLGVKKALVFYKGRSPKGTKTEWVMHEYRLLDTDNIRSKDSMRLDDWVRNKGFVLDYYDSSDQPTSHIGTEHQLLVPNNDKAFAGGIEHWNDDQQYLIRGGCGSSSAASSTAAAGHSSALVLESMKRNLSFQAIDELYLLHPSQKRADNNRSTIISGTGDGHHKSLSISETDELF